MPDASKWVDWWQKEREIKALEGIRGKPSAGTGGTASSGSSGSGAGCGAIIALLLVIGGCGVLLQRGGCIVSEESLRASARITTTKIEPQPQKGLVWVHFSIQNGSKWPMSLNLRVDISKTTDPSVLAQNSVKLLAIPARGTTEERLSFEASRLKDAGIPDISDKDLCRITYTIDWVAEAGSEPK
jgi:hypothetical protein